MYEFENVRFESWYNDRLILVAEVDTDSNENKSVEFKLEKNGGEFKLNLVDRYDDYSGATDFEPYFSSDELNNFLHIDGNKVVNSGLNSSLLKQLKKCDYDSKDMQIWDENHRIILDEFKEVINSKGVSDKLEEITKAVDKYGEKNLFYIPEFKKEFDSGKGETTQFLDRKEITQKYEIGDSESYNGRIDHIKSFKGKSLVEECFKGFCVGDRVFSYSQKPSKDGWVTNKQSYMVEEILKNRNNIYDSSIIANASAQYDFSEEFKCMRRIERKFSLELPDELNNKLEKLHKFVWNKELFELNTFSKHYHSEREIFDKDDKKVSVVAIGFSEIKDMDSLLGNRYDIVASIRDGEADKLEIFKDDIKKPLFFKAEGFYVNNLDESDKENIVRAYMRGAIPDSLGDALRDNGIIKENEYYRVKYSDLENGFSQYPNQLKEYMSYGYTSSDFKLVQSTMDGYSGKPELWYENLFGDDKENGSKMLLELKGRQAGREGEYELNRCVDKFVFAGSPFKVVTEDGVTAMKDGTNVFNGVSYKLYSGKDELICEDYISGRDLITRETKRGRLDLFKGLVSDGFRDIVNKAVNVDYHKFYNDKEYTKEFMPKVTDMGGKNALENQMKKINLLYDYCKDSPSGDTLRVVPIFNYKREDFDRADKRCQEFIDKIKGLYKQVEKSVSKNKGIER